MRTTHIAAAICLGVAGIFYWWGMKIEFPAGFVMLAIAIEIMGRNKK